jgi:hypothetical protein
MELSSTVNVKLTRKIIVGSIKKSDPVLVHDGPITVRADKIITYTDGLEAQDPINISLWLLSFSKNF